MTDDIPITDEGHARARSYGETAAKAEALRADDNRDSFGDRVQPGAFADALEDSTLDPFSAADISDGVWEGVNAGYEVKLEERYDEPHTGHFSRLGGTWWCDTCNSPYCNLA